MQIERDAYQSKLTTANSAVERIQDGSTIVHGVTLAEPPALLAAIAERAEAIISLAHPTFRDELTREAERMQLF